MHSQLHGIACTLLTQTHVSGVMTILDVLYEGDYAEDDGDQCNNWFVLTYTGNQSRGQYSTKTEQSAFVELRQLRVCLRTVDRLCSQRRLPLEELTGGIGASATNLPMLTTPSAIVRPTHPQLPASGGVHGAHD